MEQFQRTKILIGEDAFKILQHSKVEIFGIGGVGSYAAEGLARAGIGSFVLVDNKCVDITNINRQIHSTMSTVGKLKVNVMKERIMDINPNADVTIYNQFVSSNNVYELLRPDYDYVVDAIDTVQNKIELISVAKSLGIPIISSMGAGDKLDPTKFTVTDIYSTTICPLAKIMRKELKKRGVDSLKVVYSTEKPVKKHHYNNIKNNDVSVDNNDNVELCNNPNGKDNENRIIGSISFVPSVAGLIIAGEVVNDLIKKQSNTRVSH